MQKLLVTLAIVAIGCTEKITTKKNLSPAVVIPTVKEQAKESDLFAWLPDSTSKATWYPGRKIPCSLYTGKVLSDTVPGVAHRTIAKGTLILFSYNEKSIVAVVNDRGPVPQNVEFDLSKVVADSLGFTKTGLVDIQWKIVGAL